MTKSDVKDLVEELEAEINNGGFDQYFFNTSGGNASAAIEALRAIGANTTASILERAVQMFPGGSAPPERGARQDLLAQVSPDGDAFEALDEQFLRYPDDLVALLAKYLAA
jgi:hypothetical protein